MLDLELSVLTSTSLITLLLFRETVVPLLLHNGCDGEDASRPAEEQKIYGHFPRITTPPRLLLCLFTSRILSLKRLSNISQSSPLFFHPLGHLSSSPNSFGLLAVSYLILVINPALHLAHCKSLCSAIRSDIPLYIQKNLRPAYQRLPLQPIQLGSSWGENLPIFSVRGSSCFCPD